MEIFAWVLIIIGAVATFLVKPILLRGSSDEQTEQEKEATEKKIYLYKTIGMWLVIFGAAIIFYLGGTYGR